EEGRKKGVGSVECHTPYSLIIEITFSPGNEGSNSVSFSSSTIGPVTLNISCSRGSDASLRHFSSNSATESNSHNSRYSCASPTTLRQMPQNLNPCSRINGSVRSANVRSYSAT